MCGKKFIIGAIIGIVIILLIAIIAISKNPPAASGRNNPVNQTAATTTKADKIEVVHFHGTHQCWSCITVGEYALKTIKEKFPEEYENGTIVFKDINGELPQNKDMVMKYRASGSSLFINSIKNGVDNIQEDVTVWRLVSNQEQYINYLQNKINNLLNK